MPEKIYRADPATKALWGPGPWQDEPDKVVWVDEKTGLDCMARRVFPMGHFCGYVGVPQGHRLFGERGGDLSAHGGITSTGLCAKGADEVTGLCHKPLPGRPEKVWWFGFDCAHCFDIMPGMGAMLGGIERVFKISEDSEYRTLDYVKEQCRDLARQIADATTA